MKSITKKVIEAGLVSKHTLLLMQRWGYLEPEATPIHGTMQTDLKEGFAKFVEELDELLAEEDDGDIKETKFSITLRNPSLVKWYVPTGDNNPIIVFTDESTQLIFPASEDPQPGDRFYAIDTQNLYEITTVIKLWSGSNVIAHQVGSNLIHRNPDASLSKL